MDLRIAFFNITYKNTIRFGIDVDYIIEIPYRDEKQVALGTSIVDVKVVMGNTYHQFFCFCNKKDADRAVR